MAEQSRRETFEVQVLTSLGKLEGTTEKMEDHLAKLNGKVADHEKRVVALETANAAEAAVDEQNKKYVAMLKPVLLALAAALVGFMTGNWKSFETLINSGTGK